MPQRKRIYASKKVSRVSRLKRLKYQSKTPLLTSQIATLRYSTVFNLNPVTGGIVVGHVFSANGLFDPDITGAGHQPRGFDQLMQLFDHYTVLGSKITCDFMWGSDTSAKEPIMIGINVNDDVGIENTNNYDYLEDGYTQYSMLGLTRTEPIRISNQVNPLRFLGKTAADAECKGAAASNPTEQVLFHVFAAPMSSSDIEPVFVNVVLEYNVKLTEPRLAPAS